MINTILNINFNFVGDYMSIKKKKHPKSPFSPSMWGTLMKSNKADNSERAKKLRKNSFK